MTMMLATSFSLGFTPVLKAAAPADVALAVVYDTSGSMASIIRTANGDKEPKHVVAKRAFAAVIDRLERFTAPADAGLPAKRLDLTVVVFHGKLAEDAVPMGTFDAVRTRRWLDDLGEPNSATPLGDAMTRAGLALQSTRALSKHLLVLTDGQNTAGVDPLVALKAMQERASADGQPIFVHVLALDIPRGIFASLQEAGATLVGASDEKQLQSQLDFIFETQILVEAP